MNASDVDRSDREVRASLAVASFERRQRTAQATVAMLLLALAGVGPFRRRAVDR